MAVRRLTETRGSVSGLSFAIIASLALAGCATNVPPSNVKTNAKLTPTTGITRDLTKLPSPKARIPVAVYGFRDQTGQFKNSPDSPYSTLVTQGAAALLVKALDDSGWYVPVEREGLQNLLTERRIIRAIESPTDKGRPITNLPNMMPASLIIEGGVVAYETNVRTGGKGANYLGIGSSTQYRVDQVTVSLRSVDVRYGQILNTVSVTKTLYSYQLSASIYKYIAYQKLLQLETGFATNEPAQLAVREAIEAAVIHLTVNGIRDRYLELQEPSQWFSPIVQAYANEAVANIGEEPTDEEQRPVALRPIQESRDPVMPLPFLTDAPPAGQAPLPTPRAAPRPAPRPTPPAATAPPAVPQQSVAGPQSAPVPTAQPVAVPPAATAPTARSASPASAPARTAAPVAAVPPLPKTAPAEWGTPLAPPASAAPSSRVPAAAAPASGPSNGLVKPTESSGKDDIFNLYWRAR